MKPLLLYALYAAAKTPDVIDYPNGLPNPDAGGSQIQQALQIVFAVAGALAVLMIVIAGLRFITGQGNPQEISKARSTIVYAVVGLLVAIAAEAIVTIALNNLK